MELLQQVTLGRCQRQTFGLVKSAPHFLLPWDCDRAAAARGGSAAQTAKLACGQQQRRVEEVRQDECLQ